MTLKSMMFDFDYNAQQIVDQLFSTIIPIDWRDWLDISSREEYENLAFKLSGLSEISNYQDRIINEKTASKDLSVSIEQCVSKLNFPAFIFCHSSGTSGGRIDSLKWLYMSEVVVRHIWAPGMRAIFETSGLSKKNTAVIFVPSRIQFDGVENIGNSKILRLYSSEFSQRLMLALIKPQGYFIDEYKNSRALSSLARLLTMESIAIISAPANTILYWANVERLKEGIETSLPAARKDLHPKTVELLKLIENYGLPRATKLIQEALSARLANTTIIFSISSLTAEDWAQIRTFMHWKKDQEQFTNLYVGSEFGPLAASLRHNPTDPSPKDRMYIFPVSIPVIEKKKSFELLSRTPAKIGPLLISRINGAGFVFNIDIGDVITIKSQDGLPEIGSQILRASFQMKINVPIHNAIPLPPQYQVMVGDYFNFEELELINPKRLFACLTDKVRHLKLPLLLMGPNSINPLWNFYVEVTKDIDEITPDKLRNALKSCLEKNMTSLVLKMHSLGVKPVTENPIKLLQMRQELLKGVHQGIYPKGILKAWPLYVIITASDQFRDSSSEIYNR